MINPALYSSKSTDWETPQDFYDKLDKEFHFDLDPCCTIENKKCKGGFPIEEWDGLKMDWFGNVFMNPPYGEPEHPCKKNCKKKRCVKRGYHTDVYIPGVIDWVRKAKRQVEKEKAKLVVGLLPVRTCTRWFHKYVLPYTKIKFIEGRIHFEGGEYPAPFPSMLAIWGKK